MTSVFVSHSSKDDYFVDFLVELLRFHHVSVWVDRNNLEAGGIFTSDIENALATCDSMLVVISQHSSRSPWVVREISHFKALDASRPVIPLMLDAKADPDKLYEGLGLVTQLRCYDSFLESFRELLQLLGHDLFPPVENRRTPDRRTEDRRQQVADRRRSSVEKRLRVGLDKYVESSGRDLLEPMNRWREVVSLAQLLVSEDSPLNSFDFADRRTGDHVQLDYPTLKSMALKSWRAKFEQESPPVGGAEAWGIETGQVPLRPEAEHEMTGAAYVIDDVVDELVNAYTVTPKQRRLGQRRSDTPRRQS
jgi:hypothetical protein